jgi:hypothetical protein
MSFLNIFLNNLGKQYSLVSEDSGNIIVTNSFGQYRDFFQYQVFDEKYIKLNYNFNNPTIIRRNTFLHNDSGQWHSSDLDDVSYNIDLSSISFQNFKIWDNFINNPQVVNYDENYMGSFFAVLQLIGHPHQINGNNDKWVLSDDTLYPVFRNEGSFFEIDNLDISDNLIFDKYHYSSSYNPYMKILSNTNVIDFRNKTFKKIVDNKDLIIKDLDSIYYMYSSVHKRYNDNFLWLKLHQYKYFKKILSNNIDSIDDYLDSGFTILFYNGNELKIKSTRKNKLQISFGDKLFYMVPNKFEFDENSKKIKEFINEFTIQNISDLTEIKIIDLTLNKTLEIEKDYNILTVN